MGVLGPVPTALGRQKKKGRVRLRPREYPDPPFTLRKMTGSAGSTSCELSQKLDALRCSRKKCADGGEVRRRGAAKVLGIDSKTLREWAPDPETFYPRGDPSAKIHTPGESFFSRKIRFPPGGISEKSCLQAEKVGGGRKSVTRE